MLFSRIYTAFTSYFNSTLLNKSAKCVTAAAVIIALASQNTIAAERGNPETPNAAPASPGPILGDLCSVWGTQLSIAGAGLTGSNIYQWGTGNTPGQNIIASGAWTLTHYVSPTTATTYWVRILNTATGAASPASFATVNITSLPPDYIPYVPNVCANSSVTLTALGGRTGTNGSFQWGTGAVGTNIIVGETAQTITVTPAATTTYWVRRVDAAPCVRVTDARTIVVTVIGSVVAPTAISSSNSFPLCNSGTTLTANGSANGGTYQWGTGNVIGENVLNGLTYNGIWVTPSATTTYWVRIKSPGSCQTYSSGAMLVVSVGTVAGVLSTEKAKICKNTVPSNIVLTGNSGNVIKWQSSGTSAFSGSPQNISNTSNILTGTAIGALSSTRYFRAVVQNPGCNQVFTAPIAITVPPSITYSGSWNGELTDFNEITISQNLTLSSDLTACSCKVVGNATLTIPAGKSLVLQGKIEVNPSANVIVQDKGSLVQIDENATNSGNISVMRQTTPMRATDFTYWSSPVASFMLTNVSPATKSDKFYSFDPTINNWLIHANGAVEMQKAKGYIVRAPQGWSLTNATNGRYTANFVGVPNNGQILTPLIKSQSSFNLIGNPYPSAIDIDAFLTDPANENLTQGTVYLWTHNTGVSASIPGNQTYNYTADDYAKYNLTGGVKTASAVLGGVTPTGKIAAGQAFFIEAKSTLANGNYSLKFNNKMRVTGQNSQFFKASSELQRHRIWLNISNSNGAYDEALIGYVEGATNEFDNKYDGATFPAGNPVAIYSILEQTSLSIQGRALPFTDSDTIPLGYVSNIAGLMTIALEDVDGLFADQLIYLFDNASGTLHNLKSGSYNFMTTVGTFDNRFELRFVGESLSVGTPTLNAAEVNAYANAKMIYVQSDALQIENISIFDLSGKLLFDAKNIDASTYQIPANFESNVVIVKIGLNGNNTEVRKVMIR